MRGDPSALKRPNWREQKTVLAAATFIKAHILPQCNGNSIVSRKALEQMIVDGGYEMFVNRSVRSRRCLITNAMNHIAPRWGRLSWIIK